MIIGLSLAVLAIGIILIMAAGSSNPFDADFMMAGAICIMISFLVGFLILGNLVPVDTRQEKVTKFVVGEMGLIIEHPFHGLLKTTDFRIIEDAKSAENEMFIEYHINSYESPLEHLVVKIFPVKKGAEKDLNTTNIPYKAALSR